MGQEDEMIVSGSDDWRIYIWKIPQKEAGEDDSPEIIQNTKEILLGHR